MGTCFLYGNAGVPFSGFPEFTYTGDFQFISDGEKNWRIKFLTSGTLVFQKLKSAAKGIDVFCVGGGGGGRAGYSSKYGGGGGAGYTKTTTNLIPFANVEYPIIVGAGGTGVEDGNGTDGGETSAFDVTASGGQGAFNYQDSHTKRCGGDGGSGGGSGNSDGNSSGQGSGGTDGGNGTGECPGTGQGSTTREFGEADGTLYSTGGNGDGSGASGYANTGDGGSGTYGSGKGAGGSGGSGIVVIRNARG